MLVYNYKQFLGKFARPLKGSCPENQLSLAKNLKLSSHGF